MIREGIAFTVGVAVGAVGVKLYLDTKYKAQVQEEMAAIREAYQNKYAATDKEEPEGEGAEEETKGDRLNHSAPIREDAEKLKTNYQAITDAYTKVAKDDPNNDPVIITPEEYADADEKYALEAFDYYPADDIMMSGDEEVDNAADLLGKENLEEFKASDEDTMYIKNDLFMIMYEVCKA